MVPKKKYSCPYCHKTSCPGNDGKYLKAFRKKYMRLKISHIDVDKNQIRITGPKAALASAVQADKALNKEVPSFVRDWCARQDSNLWPTD